MDKIEKEEPFIMTGFGRKVYIMKPELNTFDIQDIAFGLSKQTRFNGHIAPPKNKFGRYSIAQHSVYVNKLSGHFYGLMHDAPEAFIGDAVTPLKNELGIYKEIEDRMDAEICRQFLIPNSEEKRKAVKEADFLMLCIEAKYMAPWIIEEGALPEVSINMHDVDPTFTLWSPAEAYRKFLEIFWIEQDIQGTLELV